MSKTKDFEFTFGMREYPFYRKGMSLEDWKAERKYMSDHLKDVRSGKYKPLWKQREELQKEAQMSVK